MYGDGSRPGLTSDGKPLPAITPLNRKFWELTRQSIFSLQTCATCGDRHVPESPICPQCLGDEQDWRPASGEGTLESWADFHRAYWDGFKNELPYRVCLVRLKEGPLFVSNLVGGSGIMRIGAPVFVVFRRISEEIVLPNFSLA